MIREFVMTEFFDYYWSKLNLTDDDLENFQNFLLQDPQKGNIIQNTNGIRKVRWKLGSKGKQGGIRCLYIDFEIYETIYLLMVYPKNQKEDLTEKEKQNLRKLVKKLSESMSVEEHF